MSKGSSQGRTTAWESGDRGGGIVTARVLSGASVFFICKGTGWIPAHSTSNFLLFLQNEMECVTSFG